MREKGGEKSTKYYDINVFPTLFSYVILLTLSFLTCFVIIKVKERKSEKGG